MDTRQTFVLFLFPHCRNRVIAVFGLYRQLTHVFGIIWTMCRSGRKNFKKITENLITPKGPINNLLTVFCININVVYMHVSFGMNRVSCMLSSFLGHTFLTAVFCSLILCFLLHITHFPSRHHQPICIAGNYFADQRPGRQEKYEKMHQVFLYRSISFYWFSPCCFVAVFKFIFLLLDFNFGFDWPLGKIH